MLADQILPDGHRIPTARRGGIDRTAVALALLAWGLCRIGNRFRTSMVGCRATPSGLVGEDRFRRLSDSRWQSRGAPRWRASAGGLLPAANAPLALIVYTPCRTLQRGTY